MSMKAAVVSERGGPEGMKITKIAIPTPSDTQVLVKVHAYGPNPIDVLIRAGHFPPPPFVTGGGSVPYTDGMDGAGTVESVGSKVKHLKKGERVFWLFSATGTCAEYALIDAKFVFHLSPKLSYTQGAALGIPFLTALRVIDIKAHAKKGTTECSSTELVARWDCWPYKSLSCESECHRSAGTAEVLELVRKCGADHVVNHRDAERLGRQILAITKGAGR
ncbi:PREDICTED: quinone oxidoreductase-like [Priapulus caudatus]|uniref:Quinone oxidoreductase-like n=1 Tax=Priapulus caudatus TaxID=37621 RepID=A0ABM1EUV8_PRICU|nr:PREDICTED: quinone oxidoreductase-like [Priapulus caudatus]